MFLALILEPDFAYLDALAPYQPLAMKVSGATYCKTPPRYGLHFIIEFHHLVSLYHPSQLFNCM